MFTSGDVVTGRGRQQRTNYITHRAVCQRPDPPGSVSTRRALRQRTHDNRAGCARYAARVEGGDVAFTTLRTVIDIMTRATPLKIRLMPTSVPSAQAELDGHCM